MIFSSGYGAVLSSYAYNPRIVDATNAIQNWARRYQKTSDLPTHKLFAVDYFSGGDGTLITPQYEPHFRENGWNVLFTDGSVQFSRNAQANKLIQNFVDEETATSNAQADQIFNYLELDH